MNIIVDVQFANLMKKRWYDTLKRVGHLADRMRLRGISIDNIKEAVQKGSKKLQKDGTILAEFRWYKIVYREFDMKDFKKVYPVTVIEV